MMTDSIKYTWQLLKKIVLVFGILFLLVFIGNAQELTLQDQITQFSWKSPVAIFEDNGQLSYSFKAFDEQDYSDITQRWGYFVQFHADGSFSTAYHAPCGLDCFTRVFGTYELHGADQLALHVLHINRSELCGQASEQVNQSLGRFKVKLADGKLSLVK